MAAESICDGCGKGRNHRTQDGCWNCARMFYVERGYEDPEEFYCNVNEDRPETKCPECDEPIPCVCGNDNDDLQSALWSATWEWKDAHEVLAQDICDEWVKGEEAD